MFLLTDLEDPNSTVVFYLGCVSCDEIVVDYLEFYNYSKEYHQEQCDKHTESTTHNQFFLGSVVRHYICGECSEEWRYGGTLDEWSKGHMNTTGHKYFGFARVTRDMYETSSKEDSSE